MKQLLPIILIALIHLVLSQNTYYISPLGDDILGRGTMLLPWKTLNKAHSVAQDGDTVKVLPGVYLNQALDITKNIAIEGEILGEYLSIFRSSKIVISASVTLKKVVIEPILTIGERGHVTGDSEYIKLIELHVGKDAKFEANHLTVNKTLIAFPGSVLQLTNANLQGEQNIQAGANLQVKSSEAINLVATVAGSAGFENVTFRETAMTTKPFIRLNAGKLSCEGCVVVSKRVPPAIHAERSTVFIAGSQFSNIGYSTSSGNGGALYASECDTKVFNTLITQNVVERGASFYCSGGAFNIQNSEISRNRGYFAAEGYCFRACAFSESNVVYLNNTSTTNSYKCRTA